MHFTKHPIVWIWAKVVWKTVILEDSLHENDPSFQEIKRGFVENLYSFVYVVFLEFVAHEENVYSFVYVVFLDFF